MDLLDHGTARRLRSRLLEVGYRYDTVAALLGPVAHGALSRNETVPGLRALPDTGPLATLTRLWPLQAPVTLAHADAALPGLLEPLCAAGVLQASVGEVRARLDIRPYADETHDWWVVSDLTPGMDGRAGRVAGDHVLGVGAASTTLAQLTVPGHAGRALDLGTGCGVQALHLATHADEVVGTDVNPRALAMARLTTSLNGLDPDLRAGNLFEPVEAEGFDLIVTNPPFVISPATGERLVYRDSGMPGDEVVERIVRSAPAHLRPGGWCQVLANWVHRSAEPWQQRVATWLEPTGCDAWVVQRESIDPARYVELWLNDAGLHGGTGYRRRYEDWLAWFDRQHIEGVGFGWVNLHRPEQPGRRPVHRVEEWPHEVEQPLGPEVAAWAAHGVRLAGADDRTLLETRLRTRADVAQQSLGRPGAADPERIVLRQQRGLRRARTVDTVTAAVVGACDGELRLGQILDAVGSLLEDASPTLRAQYLPVVRDLVADGFVQCDPPGQHPCDRVGPV